MRKKKILTTVVVLAATVMMAFAGSYLLKHENRDTPPLPSAKDELEKLAGNFTGSTEAGMAGTIRLYDGEETNKVEEEQQFTFLKKGAAFYCTLGPLQTAANGRYLAQVDTVNKIVAVSKIEGGAKKEMEGGLMPLAGLFNDTAHFKMTGKVVDENGLRTLTIENEMVPEVKYWSITYSPADYKIKRAVIAWRKDDGPLRENKESGNSWVSRIEYREPPMPASFADSLVNRVFTEHDGIMDLNARYRGFTIYNNGL